MAKMGEAIVKDYLEGKGLTVRKIPECDIKNVDFEVFVDNNVLFLLEEKTLETGSSDWNGKDPTYNSISKHVYEALKQFKSTNPNNMYPNVLSFTNMDSSRDIQDLIIVLTGCALFDNNKWVKIHNVGRIKNDLSLIDLYLWFDHDSFTDYLWGDNNPEHKEVLVKYLELQ